MDTSLAESGINGEQYAAIVASVAVHRSFVRPSNDLLTAAIRLKLLVFARRDSWYFWVRYSYKSRTWFDYYYGQYEDYMSEVLAEACADSRVDVVALEKLVSDCRQDRESFFDADFGLRGYSADGLTPELVRAVFDWYERGHANE